MLACFDYFLLGNGNARGCTIKFFLFFLYNLGTFTTTPIEFFPAFFDIVLILSTINKGMKATMASDLNMIPLKVWGWGDIVSVLSYL